MGYPADLRYSKDHEWVRLVDGLAEIGITAYAQDQLGDVVFVDLPQAGRSLGAGESFGTIESVKAVSELFAPVAGEVVAVNTDLTGHPEQVNTHPHETWMIRLRPSDPGATASLLDAAQYEALIGT